MPTATERGSRTASGVFLADDFRTNLVIDRYNPVFTRMRGSKTDAMRSENSEDVLTWNVFRSLAQVNPSVWFPALFARAFQRDSPPSKLLTVDLWRRVEPPSGLRLYQKDEGESEVDVAIESESFVWCIEAKYRSDVSERTTNNAERDQVLRNVDIGSWHAGVRQFFFSLLVLGESSSPKGVSLLHRYCTDPGELHRRLPHRPDRLPNLAAIGALRWSDCAEVLNGCALSCAVEEDERIIAAKAVGWLAGKGIRVSDRSAVGGKPVE